MKNDSNTLLAPLEVPTIQKNILIVEDETVFARAVQKKLLRSDFACRIAGTLGEAREACAELAPDLILLDMRLPDGSGLELLEEIKNGEYSFLPALVMSAYGEIEDAVSAMKLGAIDYLKKPIDLEELLVKVRKVLEREELNQKLVYSSKREQHAVEGVEFIGDCQQIREVKAQVEKIAAFSQNAETIPPTVLVLGETGSGKDVIARLLHASSIRHDRPFVHVDCASLPRDLIEAELFGHEKGAFTNALASRTGLIEAAEDGLVFLDEIGELSLELQSKLLAVLERRSMRKVGTSREQAVKAWFLAATNKDIEKMSMGGEFRADLFYRLNVLSITMPPLRERGNDILMLATHFAEQTARRYGIEPPEFEPECKKAMLKYHWPGNVRELKHMIERSVLLSSGSQISAELLQLQSQEPVSETGILTDDATLESAELALIRQALERTGGNVSRAARELGVTRMALRYRLKKYNL